MILHARVFGCLSLLTGTTIGGCEVQEAYVCYVLALIFIYLFLLNAVAPQRVPPVQGQGGKQL
jgi:hypothetical protein